MNLISYAQIPRYARNRIPFVGSSSNGEWFDAAPGQGLLSDRSYARLCDSFGESISSFVYVVFSYDTPIAWFVPMDDASYWTLPNESFSVTTARIQSIMRSVVGA